ncbi:cell division protein FtsQ/DivIB [Streptomyces sp. WMMB 322]|uniref:cell division protein FtsQ/DivIB n=1 Tax=Streptomyces sp. WMMB 322 TaxID=1286821 RepID=UPI000D15071F|nr:FtsQ-type POTRA domain-containing protein [Streptomyces sp. WMMB 322]
MRRGARIRRLRALLVVFALLLGLAGFGAWALYGSNWVLVERVSVSGNKVLTEKQVSDAARIPVGTPLLSVDRAAAERRLTTSLPRLDEVRVVRAFPHGIGIEVTERKPELVMKHGGKFVEVDAEGVRFDVVQEQPKGVPLLVMEVERSAGLRHFGKERLRREAVRAAAALPDSVRRDTRTVRMRSYDSITLELTGGRTVQWGSGERGGAKAESLTALMKASKGARHFDVSVPSAPASSGS